MLKIMPISIHMYKLWLIRIKHFFSFATYNDNSDPYMCKLFSIEIRRGSGKHSALCKLVAIHNTSTGIYHFDGNRFVTYDEMLDYVLVCK
jgi:hypothetical protein